MEKILTFVTDGENFLALYSPPHPHHKDGWFTITGGVEAEETYEKAVARELNEETGLMVKHILFLNWGSIYEWEGTCEEYNYLSIVNPGEIILNEEHSTYEWLPLDEFVERIEWDDDKELLKTVLRKALQNQTHFTTLRLDDYRY